MSDSANQLVEMVVWFLGVGLGLGTIAALVR